jgi:hypothetical protein
LRLQAKRKVNWAKGAAELAKAWIKNSLTNLRKLTPPCLHEQIQFVLDFEQGLLSRVLAAHSAAISQLKQAGITVCREAQLTIDKRVVLAGPTSTVAKQPGKMVSDENGLIDVPIYVGTLTKQPCCSQLKSSTMKEKRPSAGSPVKRRVRVEERLVESLRQQVVAKNKLGQLQQ